MNIYIFFYIYTYYNMYKCILIFIVFFIIFYLINIQFKERVYEKFQNDTIPKIIIQTWKTNTIPKKYEKDIL